jgi:hypothetical protein
LGQKIGELVRLAKVIVRNSHWNPYGGILQEPLVMWALNPSSLSQNLGVDGEEEITGCKQIGKLKPICRGEKANRSKN